MARVLIMESDAGTREYFVSALSEEHEVAAASDARTGLFLVTAETWDVVLLDPALQTSGRIHVVRYVQELEHRPEVIVVADADEMAQVVETLRAGAFEFLEKPVEPGDLQKVVANAAQLRSFRSEKRALEKRNRERRRQLEALVKERTQQMEQIFANVPGMLFQMIVHPDGFRLFSFVSASCQELLGIPQERLTDEAEAFDALIHPDDGARFEHARSLAEDTHTRFRFEGRFLLPTGKIRWLQCVANPTPLPERCVAWDGILVDVTERVELQSQLLLADRLATVGTMAAAMAHEVNNPLSYITANLEELGDQLRGQGAASMVQEALDGVGRIENAMRDLSTFVRSPEDVPRRVSVNKVLDASVRLASNEIRHRAQLVREYKDEAEVHADESSLGQLFLNLLIVAAHSIPEGNAHGNNVVAAVWVEGNQAHIEISDTSPGLPREALERAFDPFADPAERLRSGLGLYVCQRIAKTLGGVIHATSSPACGNRFHVRLPLAAESIQKERPHLRLVPSRKVRVLVVDDEELVLRAFVRTLEGHEVHLARSGREAVKLLKTEEAYDLVLCDVMMPDMNGEDVYHAAEQVRPGTQKKFVFVTGGAFTKEASAFLHRVPNRRIQKPFSKASIRDLIEDLRI